MTEKIALVAVNARSSHSNPVVFLMRKLIRQRIGEECVIHELTINMSWKECLEALTAETYGYYFFSVYIWNSALVRILIPMLKKIRPESLIIAGGPEAEYSKDFALIQGLDVIIEGQAEAFVAGNFFSRGMKPPRLSGEGPVRITLDSLPIDESPFPYDEEDKAVVKDRLIYYEASRGCRFQCAYCLSSRQDQRLEYRKLEAVKDHFRRLIRLEPKTVKMVDRTFNADRAFAHGIWKFLMEIDSPIPFHFELHPLFLEEEDFVLLENAKQGLFLFEVGIQSTDANVLKKSGRAGEWDIVEKNLRRLCGMKNIHTHVDQIVGLPGDNLVTASKSFHQILNLGPDEFQLGFLKILPGTQMQDLCPQYGIRYSCEPPYEVFQTNDLPFSDFKKFYSAEKTVRQFYNSGYFRHLFRYMIPKIDDGWNFFNELGKAGDSDLGQRNWPALANTMLEVSARIWPEERDYITDLLRYDWCFFAPSQGYPDFLPQDSGIKEKRSAVYRYLKLTMPDVSQQDFYHSVVFYPQSLRMIKEFDGQIALFLREGKGRHVVMIPLSEIDPEAAPA